MGEVEDVDKVPLFPQNVGHLTSLNNSLPHNVPF